MRRLYREEYADFTVKHFHEELRKRHNYTLGYTVTRLALQSAGLVRKARRRGQHRKKRPRHPLPGVLLFQDASTHRWIGALDHDLDLVVTLDDATGALYSALLVAADDRGAGPIWCALHGSWLALLSDPEGEREGGQTTADAGRPGAGTLGGSATSDPIRRSGRGRMERVFGTLQQRLPPELRRAGISTMTAANAYLCESVCTDRRSRTCSACRRIIRLAATNCVRWARRSLQIPPQLHRHHYVTGDGSRA